ncbi:hypothetical protein [Geothrix sp. 21YS21S-2]|uniref:hypothetical protein n=1 Tax=Geothrix sp. 21YS21S-2 TaxID=3068893 RepID=UPI0027B92432|nr:hypothetical protein [Geothrix sp. 21YS21S-2]
MIDHCFPSPLPACFLELAPNSRSVHILNEYFQTLETVREVLFRKWNQEITMGNQPRPGIFLPWIYGIRQGISPLSPKLKRLHPILLQEAARKWAKEVKSVQREWGDRRMELAYSPSNEDEAGLEYSKEVQLDLVKDRLNLPAPGGGFIIPFDRARSFLPSGLTQPISATLLCLQGKLTDQFRALVRMEPVSQTLGPAEEIRGLDWGAKANLFWNLGNPIKFPSEIQKWHRRWEKLQAHPFYSHRSPAARKEWRAQFALVKRELNLRYQSWYWSVAEDIFREVQTLVLEDFGALATDSRPQYLLSPAQKSVRDALLKCEWELMIRIFRQVAQLNNRSLRLNEAASRQGEKRPSSPVAHRGTCGSI